MPKLEVNGANLYYEEQGSGAETILFAHGLLWSGHMFKEQINALKNRYRCISFDFRGQGQSEITSSGYDMETLTQDTLALIEALDCKPCHFLGLSMGGFIGQRLAINHPTVLKSLMLLETTADPESEAQIGRYRRLNLIARWFGLGLVDKRVMKIMFGEKFLNDSSRAQQKEAWRKHLVVNHRIGITRAVKGVIYRSGVHDQLGKIKVPTLIIVGDQDVATPPAKSQRMNEAIAGSQLVIISGAGHTSTVEEPAAVNKALETFLGNLKKAP